MTMGIGRSARMVFAASIPSLVVAGERDRLLAVACLRDDVVSRPLEQGTQVEPDNRLVFRDQDAHGT
jgi:hypothetical protein